jgi:hypothetical protein
MLNRLLTVSIKVNNKPWAVIRPAQQGEKPCGISITGSGALAPAARALAADQALALAKQFKNL